MVKSMDSQDLNRNMGGHCKAILILENMLQELYGAYHLVLTVVSGFDGIELNED